MTKLNKRDTIIICTAALLILFGLLFNALYIKQPVTDYGYIEGETIYPRAYVVLWRQDNGYCHLSDGTKHEYVVYAEDFFEGDIITCTMGDMGTPDDISDDRMILYYSGGYNIEYGGTLDKYLNIFAE